MIDVDPRTRTIVAHSVDGVRTFGEGDRFATAAVPWLSFDVAEAFKGLEFFDWRFLGTGPSTTELCPYAQDDITTYG